MYQFKFHPGIDAASRTARVVLAFSYHYANSRLGIREKKVTAQLLEDGPARIANRWIEASPI